MGFKELDIVLNNTSGVYSAGQSLAGTVHISNNKPQKISGIQLNVKGQAKVLFTDCSFWEETTYRANEVYLQVHAPLLSDDGEASFTLAPGRYQLNFSLELPVAIAPSFEGKYGSTRYKVQVKINRTWKRTRKFSRPFNVLPVTDCSSPTDATPVETVLTKVPKLLPLDCGVIHARLHVSRGRHYPGDDIIVNADIINNTGNSIKSSKIILIQHITFRADRKVKEISQILHKTKRGRFNKGELWDQVAIPIPASTEASHLPFCNIMDISYSIQLIVNPGRLYKKLKVRSNVHIEKLPDINSIHSFLAALTPFSEPNPNVILQLAQNGRILPVS